MADEGRVLNLRSIEMTLNLMTGKIHPSTAAHTSQELIEAQKRSMRETSRLVNQMQLKD